MNQSSEGKSYILDLSLVAMLHDGDNGGKSLVLESYFNDVYKLFFRKLSEFECQSKFSEAEVKKLKSLLDELLKVKGMIAERGEKDVPDKVL